VYAHILLSTDGSELATKGVRDGLALASALGAAATILTVTDPWPLGLGVADQTMLDDWATDAAEAAKLILEEAAKMAATAGVSCTTAYVPDKHPAEAIIEYVEAHAIDLIVIASHGRRGFRRMLLGSQAAEVLSRSGVPVLIIK
jgi:nucleotide-binding universal stress UspA family protein